MRLYDLDLLTYCRDPKCERMDAHPDHTGRTCVVVAKPAPEPEVIDIGPVYVTCTDCGLARDEQLTRCGYCHSVRTTAQIDRPRGNAGVGDAVIEVTYAAIGTYVPTSFGELYRAVVDEYGSLAERSVQRAVRALVDARQVASLSSAWVSRAVLRNPRVNPPGWYLRYDSPKLWSASGLRDLMAVVADRQTEGLGNEART